MCGFIGRISKSNKDFQDLRKANNLLICRGPDECKELNKSSKDLFGESNLNLEIIFNRLSIIDLSPKAAQPMISKKYNTISIFNGEIYNHKILRSELEDLGEVFSSNHSDSEVVLVGLSKYGTKFIDKLIGQFAIVFTDIKKNKTFLIRDRVGQKPLFYSTENNELSFSSNLISLSKLNKLRSIDDNQVMNYLNLGVIPSPNTIFKNIYKVEPGCVIEISYSHNNLDLKVDRYWNIEQKIDNLSFDKEVFENLFSDAVTSRLVADVPIANFSSGGLDSTSIIKNLHDNGHDINTYSIGYVDSKYDESKWFREVSKKYNTNSIVETLSTENIDNEVDKILSIFDEPYSDPSIIPSYLISSSISKNFKVAISGDGGDELLGGYLRFTKMLKRKNFMHFLSYLNSIYPNYLGTGNRFLSHSKNFTEAYSSYHEDRNLLKLLNIKYENNIFKKFIPKTNDLYKKLLITDYNFYLPEMMMLKVDRTSMANSLEVRSPFVDHRLIEYIISSNYNYLDIRNPKALLKNYIKEDFDSDFLNRKKMGFVFNLEGWIFNNIEHLNEVLAQGGYVYGMNKNILNKLSINRSRINSQRIWKLYILEKYLDRV